MSFCKNLLLSAVLLGLAVFGSSAASAQGVQLFAVLNGGNQLSPTLQAGAGDPNGYGAAAITFQGTTICYGIVISGLDKPTEAHIHHAVAGQNDPNDPPPVIFQVPQAGNPGSVSGCTTASSTAVLADIKKNPSAYYVNVHTIHFPNGALRGQLF
jgi:hypothetical protein